jgi:amino acid permease
MSYSRKNSRINFVSIAMLISLTAVASWQFYEYATFKHDNGLINIQGGVIHLLLALLLAFFACGLGFFMASRFLRYDANDQLHITSPPDRHTSPGK